MKSTLEELFASFFELPETAVVEIPGRMFPVELEHIALKDEPLSIRNDVVKRGQRRQFQVEPFLEASEMNENELERTWMRIFIEQKGSLGGLFQGI